MNQRAAVVVVIVNRSSLRFCKQMESSLAAHARFSRKVKVFTTAKTLLFINITLTPSSKRYSAQDVDFKAPPSSHWPTEAASERVRPRAHHRHHPHPRRTVHRARSPSCGRAGGQIMIVTKATRRAVKDNGMLLVGGSGPRSSP